MAGTDLLGRPVSETERHVLDTYEAVKALAARSDLPPCVERNAKKALGCLWQAVNDLQLELEQLHDLGV